MENRNFDSSKKGRREVRSTMQLVARNHGSRIMLETMITVVIDTFGNPTSAFNQAFIRKK